MDVGFTKSNKNHPAHFVSGLVVVMVMWSLTVFAIRPLVVSGSSEAGAAGSSPHSYHQTATNSGSSESEDVGDRVASGLL